MHCANASLRLAGVPIDNVARSPPSSLSVPFRVKMKEVVLLIVVIIIIIIRTYQFDALFAT